MRAETLVTPKNVDDRYISDVDGADVRTCVAGRNVERSTSPRR